jgi:leader peptidase (prepilin peptidase)/N-methyltransferase
VLVITDGRGVGGGDVKLMAVCGLFLGWKLVLFAFFLGCLLGS